MMEKISKMKRKLFKFLPKQSVASSIAFHQNPNLSPSSNVPTKGYRSSVTKVSIIPKEARRKHRSASFSAREPSSPKVTCMGKVKCKKREKTHKQKMVQKISVKNDDSDPCDEKKENILLWIFKGRDEEEGQKGNDEKGFVLEEEKQDTQIAAPSLGKMNKFSSGRGSLCDFDVARVER
ncbi:hypothetical protein Lal_00012148 [Lupinus albus]|uniref:Uncharacterized protein n=1 Tax=Lupinus albus TaxID=3870 RepID=A0A6A5MAR2_LUPAL|nr:hypothetical protein Lalb_Chr05g0229691 [Lupinus albus]KAF1871931.1 hypothetical protein Lal_00012148 [Lupinus albus]